MLKARILAAVDRLQRAQLWIAASALMALMLVTVTDVTLRYAFKRPVRGSYELVECMLVVFVFHGLAAAFFHRRNIVIDIIDYAVSRRTTAILIRLSDLLTVAGLVLLFWTMLGPALQAYEYGDRKIETSLPVYVLWILALAGMAGTIVAALAVLVARPATADDGPVA